MPIVSLVGSRVRCYPEIILEGLGGRNAFVAANGTGKSTLIEMLFFLSRGKSFRTGVTREMKAWDSPGFGVAGGFEGEAFRRLKIEWQAGRRAYAVDETPVRGLAPYWGRWPAVVFSNEDLSLVQGGGLGRRQWVDGAVAGRRPAHVGDCLKAQQLLRQKSALLKTSRPDRRMWNALQEQLRAVTETVQEARRAVAGELSEQVTRAYRRLSAEREELAFAHRPGGAEGMEERALWEKECAVGRPLFGPHRDDWSLLLQGKELRTYGSEGQQKSAALALRLAEVERFSQGRVPAILVDDAVQELDPARRARFWELLPADGQWFVTGTSYPEAAGRGLEEWSNQGGLWRR